jgi:S1-C subfamily serine protease
MSLIPPFFFDCVVAIGALNEKKEKHWIGTGFLFAKYLKGTGSKKEYAFFLVTNKHVLKDVSLILVKFNPQGNDSSKDFPINLHKENNQTTWIGHPDPETDVAVISINPQFLRNNGITFNFFKSDEHSQTIEEMKEENISEGDFIYVLGFPMGITGVSDRKNVISRSGTIARIRNLFEGQGKDFIVDAFVFPGNSGGPVVSKPEMVSIEGTKPHTKANLIGIIKSYIPYRDIAVSIQTQQPRIIFEDNSGLSEVIPVNAILESIAEYISTYPLQFTSP